MGGLLHLFDFNQSSMARKVLRQKRHVGGLEAPRNSLELQAESSRSYCAAGDIPYSYRVEEDWSGKNCYHNEASMKKLINEEMSKKRNTKHNAPSIVARLMGMDMFPADKALIQPTEKKTGSMGSNGSKKEKDGTCQISHVPSNPNYSRGIELHSFDHNYVRDLDRWSDDQTVVKMRPREHPQEEELQKFKKEFQAFQASKFIGCSSAVELGSIPRKFYAQESLHKEKIEFYPSYGGRTASEKPIEPNGLTVNAGLHARGGSQQYIDELELFPAERKEPLFLRSRTLSGEYEQSNSRPLISDQKQDNSSAPTRIVVLKPGPDRIFSIEDSCTRSTGALEKGSIEEFLEEVKERLKCELQGKIVKSGTVARGTGIETRFREKPSDPKNIARPIEKQVGDSVTRESRMDLLRSESTRSYGSELQFNGPGSPEFMTRDSRRFLSERLRNVLKKETQMDIPVVVSGSSKLPFLDSRGKGLEHTRDTLNSRNDVSYWEIVRNGQDMQTRSFRYGPDDQGVLHRELSPRNLIRSLSAPVSGTSFGKLLLEDRHILTGVQIRRKHEVIENVPAAAKKRKERFNFKERVSNFRHGFTLRRRLFGGKIESVVAPCNIGLDSMKDIMSGPTVVMNYSKRHENPTEVPPSPASVCSSAHEEFWRAAEYPSPVSTPDVTSGDDSTMPQVFREISSNLNELRRQLNQLESDRPEETSTIHDPVGSEMELEDQAEAYIRDLLVASGLYDGSSEKSLPRWDPLAKYISNSVFEDVEESYRKSAKENGSCKKDENNKVDHKVLLDLLNEALSTVLGPPPMTMSRFRRKIVGSSMLQDPRGRKLLNCVWDIIHIYLYPRHEPSSNSVDDIVARDLRSTTWSGFIDNEINALGREVECLIIRDLVGEILKDMQI